MAKDTTREAFQLLAINLFNKILDFMDEHKQGSISRNEMIYMRDEFKSKCDLT